MREMARRILAAEQAVGIRPLGVPSDVVDEAYSRAVEREELRRRFARLQLAIARDCPTLPLDLAKLEAEVAAEDAVLQELLGGKVDTPEQAEADRAVVFEWESTRTPEQRAAAHAARWPDRPTFDDLLAEYSRLRDSQREIVVEPVATPA